MSDAHNEHESVIKTPKQLIVAVVAGFLVPIICIVLLVQYVTSQQKVGAGSEAQSPEAIAARIKPIADAGFTLKDANAPKQLLSGAEVYNANCAACHATGAAGAPKTGDAGGWQARIAQGYDKLVANAINGLRAMPPKGGNADLDNVEVERAVVYMANQSGASFKEPEVKAPASASAAAPAEAPSAGAPVASATAPLSSSPTQASKEMTVDAGKKLYEANCAACHATGAAGAPKYGDKAGWAPRLAQGADALYANAIKGKGIMPPKGGAAASDDEVKAAVDYMVAAVK